MGCKGLFAPEIDLGITFDPIGFGEDAGAMLTARMPPRAGLNCEGHISDERDDLFQVARVSTHSRKLTPRSFLPRSVRLVEIVIPAGFV